MTGKFKAGEPLREHPLSQRFAVSRGPIRDAILQLTQEGLLVGQPHKGVKIADTWDAILLPLMSELRFKIEGIAVGELLKRNDNQETLKSLRQNLCQYEQACQDQNMPSVVQLDLDFHRIILRGCGHHGLESVWLPLMGGIRLPYARHKKLIDSHAEHIEIYEAIESQDAVQAIESIGRNVMPSYVFG